MNKIWFQTGTPGNVPNFRIHLEKFNKLGLPGFSAVADSTSTMKDIIDLSIKYGVNNTCNWVPTRPLTKQEMHDIGLDVNWTIDPNVPYLKTYIDDDPTNKLTEETAEYLYEKYAKIYVDAILRIAPKERDNRFVTISTWNEVRPIVGWGPKDAPNSPMWKDTIQGYRGWAHAIARQGYYIAKEIVSRRVAGLDWFRWAPYAFAGGNPEEGYWDDPAVLEFIQYMSYHKDMFRMCLHEYSFADNILQGLDSGPSHVGRVTAYIDACTKNGIEPLPVEIKECGWYQKRLPNITRTAILNQLESLRQYYNSIPEIIGAAMWTTMLGDWSGVGEFMDDLVDPWLSLAYTNTEAEMGTPTKNIFGVDSSATLVKPTSSLKTSFGIQRAVTWESGIPAEDPMLETNLDAYVALGAKLGIYCYIRPFEIENSAKLFAWIVRKVVDKYGSIIYPVIDVEDVKLSQEQVRLFVDTFVSELGTTKFIIYTSKSRWQMIMNNSKEYKDNPLWVAWYPSSENDLDRIDVVMPTAWDDWSIWQFAQNKLYEGMKLDYNLMRTSFKDKSLTKEDIDGSTEEKRIHLITGSPTNDDLCDVILAANVSKEPVVFTHSDTLHFPNRKVQVWDFTTGEELYMINVKVISQRDTRWKDIKLGTPESTLTIGQFGCLTVAYTMLANQLGLLDSNNPVDFMNRGVSAGAYWGAYIQAHALRTVFPENIESHGWKLRSDPQMMPQLFEWIKAGIPVPVQVDFNPRTADFRNDQHWVLVVGYEQKQGNERWVMADPWDGTIGYVDSRYNISGDDFIQCLFYKKREDVPVPPPIDDHGIAKTTVNVNMRTGGGTNYPIIQIVPKNTLVRAFKSNQVNGYVYCELYDNKDVKGYIWGQYLEYLNQQSVDFADYFLPANNAQYGPKLGLQYNWNGGGLEVAQLQRLNNGATSVVMKNNQHEVRTIGTDIISLDVDTSYGEGKYYKITSPQGWLKRIMHVGEEYTRNETVHLHTIADCSLITTYSVTTQIKFEELLVNWKSIGGVTFNSVVHLAFYKDGKKIEDYWYAHGAGLVQWANNEGKLSTVSIVIVNETPLNYVKLEC